MTLIVRQQYPREIQRGVAQTLSLDVYDDADSSQQTASAGTLSLYAGTSAVLTDEAVSAGAPSTYSLLAATTDGKALAGDWLEVWSLTIGGTAYTFQRPAYLVRYPYRHVVTQSDLTELHPELGDRDTAGTLDLDSFIRAADAIVRRELIKRGNRPELVVDAWALADAHRCKALELIYRDDTVAIGDGRHRELAEHYAQCYRDEWSSITLTYDADEDGLIDAGEERRSTTPVVFLTSRKTRWGRGY